MLLRQSPQNPRRWGDKPGVDPQAHRFKGFCVVNPVLLTAKRRQLDHGPVLKIHPVLDNPAEIVASRNGPIEIDKSTPSDGSNIKKRQKHVNGFLAP
jgi:hypothetical protein